MKDHKSKIYPGAVYSFDPKNVYKQTISGVSHVIPIKMKKRNLVNPDKNIWICVNADAKEGKDENPLFIEEAFLKPMQVPVIRYEQSTPKFNKRDVECIEGAIKVINIMRDINRENTEVGKEDSDFVEKNLDALTRDLFALREKADFYLTVRDIEKEKK